MTRSLAASAASGRRHGGALSGKSRGFIYAEGIGSEDEPYVVELCDGLLMDHTVRL